MARQPRTTARRPKRKSDNPKLQISRNWRKKTRLISPSPESDQGPESSSTTGSNLGFQGFMSLPVDVFVNIASYFQPQDVLTLSRVNSFLRQMLMSRDSEPIWRSARLNLVGLPPCPKEIPEPTYAALLFSKICTLCGRRALQRMDPILLERLCGNCKKTRLMDVAQHEVDISLVLTSTTILPGYSVDWSERGPWCFYDDVQVAKTKLEEQL
ncbi:unnamed protein product [Rhizoctonia solani]|uniref:F-box domain-containing protein n=1 Tax=Rhizoctonia solani TaxID=456999 RepID=A0A8H3H0G6_9AGAM|nr:unnamed protein product [Rhizoctonia solani]